MTAAYHQLPTKTTTPLPFESYASSCTSLHSWWWKLHSKSREFSTSLFVSTKLPVYSGRHCGKMATLTFGGVCLLLFLLSFKFSSGTEESGPTVRTPLGIVEGFKYRNEDGNTSDVFLGLRYARAPVGDLRFEKPIPYEPWNGIYEAKEFGPDCIPIHRSKIAGKNFSEDCLYVNIVRPSKKPTQPTGYPILIFVHGGGFVTGNTVRYGYKSFSEHFASHGIIAVSIQYRVGPFGFFSTGDNVLPGNIGLWDLLYGIHFLREILPNFGGNPDEITLFGNSAGAAAVHALAISPHANGMFKRAIQCSASLFAEWAMNENVVDTSKKLAKELKCMGENSDSIHDCMKLKSVDEILDAIEKIGPYNNLVREFIFNPRFDHEFFPQNTEQLMKASPNIPTMFSVAEVEWALIANIPATPLGNPIGIPEEDRSHFGSRELQMYIGTFILPHQETGRSGGGFRNALFEFFVDREAPKQEHGQQKWYMRRAVEVTSDIMFVVPIIQQIEIRNALKHDSYLVYMKHYNDVILGKGALVKGSIHGIELYYVFDKERAYFEFTKDDRVYQKHILDSFRSFIVTGKPTADGTDWPTTSGGTRHVVLNPDPIVEPEFESERMNFWTRQLPEMVGVNILKRTRLPHAELHQHHTEL